MGQLFKKYAYRVRWSEEDGEYLATVAEFPSLSWPAEDQSEAFDGIVNLIKEVMEDMKESGEQIPVPLGERSYSGNVRLCIPPEQHRELAIRAAEEDVSLNRLLCSLINQPPVVRVMAASQQHLERSFDKTNIVTGSMKRSESGPHNHGPLRLVDSDDEVSTTSGTESHVTRHDFEEWDEEM